MNHITRLLAAYNVLNQVTVGQILTGAANCGDIGTVIGKVIQNAIETFASTPLSGISNEMTVIEVLEFLQEKRIYQISKVN